MPNAAPQTEPTIKQRLRALGFGVRKPTDADLVGHPALCGVFCRTIYRLDTGDVLGLYDAHSAVRDVLRPREAAKRVAAACPWAQFHGLLLQVERCHVCGIAGERETPLEWTGGYTQPCAECGTPLCSDEEGRGVCDRCEAT